MNNDIKDAIEDDSKEECESQMEDIDSSDDWSSNICVFKFGER